MPTDETDQLPPETAPADISVTTFDFASTDEASQVAHAIAATVRAISRVIDLERLDGITVAFDYASALASIDRGYPNAKVLTPTETREIIGVAMSVNVLREKVAKAHLVFNANTVLPLLDAASPFFAQAVSLIAHECGHVEDMTVRDINFPGVLLHEKYQGYFAKIIFHSERFYGRNMLRAD